MPTPTLRLNQEEIPFDQIRQGGYTPVDEYESGIIHFCQHWLNGADEFSQHTSGSTGKPKRIQLSRGMMIKSTQLTQQALSLQKGEHAVICLSADYIAGKMMLARAMEIGMHIHCINPSRFREGPLPTPPDFIALVPLQVEHILAHHDGIDFLDRIKTIIIGGAPLLRHLRDVLGNLKSAHSYETYGMTETTSHVALKDIRAGNTFFEALPETIFDVDARSCLRIKSPLTSNEWLQTNDCVRLHSPTRFEWKGRADFTINTGGIKVQPEVVESKLQTDFMEKGITNRFFIAGLPDEQYGQHVTLFVEGQLPIGIDVCASIRGPEKPRKIVCLDRFVETPSGKINRIETIALSK